MSTNPTSDFLAAIFKTRMLYGCILMASTLAVSEAQTAKPPASAEPAADLRATMTPGDLARLQQLAARAKVNPAAVSVAELSKQFQGDRRAAAMFEFVRDRIQTEAYAGCLRGAQGTLLSRAGNPVDKAMLLVQMLRAAEVECRFLTADAPEALRKAIIAGMFESKVKPPAEVMAAVPAALAEELAAPADDPALLDELARHVWVQAKVGEAWVDLDPSLRTHQVGEAPAKATAGEPLDELPEDLWQTVTVRVNLLVRNAEGRQDSHELLNTTLLAARCVDAPVVLGHEKMPTRPGAKEAPVRPVLLWGKERSDGQAFLSTGLAAPEGAGGLGDIFKTADGPPTGETDKQAILAEVIEVTLGGVGLEERTIRRTLMDWRAAKPKPAELAAATQWVTVLAVLTGEVTQDAVKRSLHAVITPSRDQAAAFEKVGTALKNNQPAVAETIFKKENCLGLGESMPWLFQSMAEAVGLLADQAQASVTRETGVRTQCDRPRVFLLTCDPVARSLRFDLGHKRVRAVGAPGQPKALADAAQVLASLNAIGAEEQLAKMASCRVLASAGSLFAEAERAKIAARLLHPGDAEKLQKLTALPESVRTAISHALEAGCTVLALERPVKAGGPSACPWYALNEQTGEILAMVGDTGDQADIEAVLIYGSAKVFNWPMSLWQNIWLIMVNYAGKMIEICDVEKPFKELHDSAIRSAVNLVRSALMTEAFGGYEPLAQFEVSVIIAKKMLDYFMQHNL